jgi:hypothetical protein
VRHRVQLHAEEARVILDIFHHHAGIAQRVGGLQLVARVGHFGHQAPHPGVQLQLQQTPVLGGADILALDQLQVVRNARQQEDVRQTRVDTAVGGGVGGIVQRRFLGGVGREEAGVIAIL